MRKRRRRLTAEEQSDLLADIILSRSLTTKKLMLKYNASRSLIDTMKRRVPRETTKQDAFNSIQDNSGSATCA